MLIKYELRKLASGSLKWLLFLIFAANFLLYYLFLIPAFPDQKEQKLYNNMVKKTSDRQTLERELNVVEERIQSLEEEALQRLEEGKEPVPSDEEAYRNVISELQEEYREALGFYSFVEEVGERSERLLKFSVFSKEGSFSRKNIEKTAEDFAGMKDVEVVPLNGDGLKRMQEFPLTDLLLLVAAGLLAFQIFGREGRSGMQKLLNTTVHGGKRLISGRQELLSVFRMPGKRFTGLLSSGILRFPVRQGNIYSYLCFGKPPQHVRPACCSRQSFTG